MTKLSSHGRVAYLIVLLFGCGAASNLVGADLTRPEAEAALRKAVRFFRQQVSAEGGYLWRYAADLSRQEGEVKAKSTTVWVQPPGTPTVGQALLTAYRRTGDSEYLHAARDAAIVLVRGQLQSGGWDYRIELASADRAKYAYRTDDRKKGRDTSTLDDDTTQAALRFLMQMDGELQFQDEAIHDTAKYALRCLLETQYPNGAWPQRFDAAPDPDRFPVKAAAYPSNWSWTHPDHDYRSYYTLNDNTLADMITTMFAAADVYGDPDYGAAAKRGGDFLLLAQMPDPQPAWAQQYNAQMHPAWARRFEPPAVTGGESQGAIRILMEVFQKTGEEKYLAPIPRAIDYLQSSALSDGRLARFYELKTNRPLYFTKDYQLTYSDEDMPTHYSFKSGSGVVSLRARYEALRGESADAAVPLPAPRLTSALRAKATAAVHALDERGAWVESGQLRTYDDSAKQVIDCRTFVSRVDALSLFIAAAK